MSFLRKLALGLISVLPSIALGPSPTYPRFYDERAEALDLIRARVTTNPLNDSDLQAVNSALEYRGEAAGDWKITWNDVKRANLEFAAQVAGSYSGSHIMVNGRDLEYVHDVLKEMGEPTTMINISRKNAEKESVHDYVMERIIPLLERGESVVFLDTGWRGKTLYDTVLATWPEYASQMKVQFVVFKPGKDSEVPPIPSSRSFLLALRPDIGVDPRAPELRPTMRTPTVESYEKVPHYTYRSSDFKQKPDGTFDAYSRRPANPQKENQNVNPDLARAMMEDQIHYVRQTGVREYYEKQRALNREMSDFIKEHPSDKPALTAKIKDILRLHYGDPDAVAAVYDTLERLRLDRARPVVIDPTEVGLSKGFHPADVLSNPDRAYPGISKRTRAEQERFYLQPFSTARPNSSTYERSVFLEEVVNAGATDRTKLLAVVHFLRERGFDVSDEARLSADLTRAGIDFPEALAAAKLIAPELAKAERIGSIDYVETLLDLARNIHGFPLDVDKIRSASSQESLIRMAESKLPGLAGEALDHLSRNPITDRRTMNALVDLLAKPDIHKEAPIAFKAYALLLKNLKYFPGPENPLVRAKSGLRKIAALSEEPDRKGDAEQAKAILAMFESLDSTAPKPYRADIDGKSVDNYTNEQLFAKLFETLDRMRDLSATGKDQLEEWSKLYDRADSIIFEWLGPHRPSYRDYRLMRDLADLLKIPQSQNGETLLFGVLETLRDRFEKIQDLETAEYIKQAVEYFSDHAKNRSLRAMAFTISDRMEQEIPDRFRRQLAYRRLCADLEILTN